MRTNPARILAVTGFSVVHRRPEALSLTAAKFRRPDVSRLPYLTGLHREAANAAQIIRALAGIAGAMVNGAGVGDLVMRRSPTLVTARYASRRLGGAKQAAQLGQRLQMLVSVAEHHIDHGHALEIVPDLVLHGHPYAAVKLDRLLTDVLA
jgi:hypothetical protein